MIRQILSDETMNRKGYITLNDGVNWDEYRKNPVLMLEHEDDKQPIGRIDNIRFEDNAWYGDSPTRKKAGRKKNSTTRDSTMPYPSAVWPPKSSARAWYTPCSSTCGKCLW